ncbi:S8 family serine peptidase [Thermomonas carbonis]|uniref:S8 family serine peptidase n=1 Tax=Thermomonas carbonis TaxID=1463158 RepID=A0A7G9SLQ4_9GAMM|nr:S8 family serine peptidase [Thermomonas carbonis]QNN68779.1 S8 family serine peptidase [Thermomonas carbonis]GHC08837.1 hypothetical protein GCM10010080_24850 [Thermomonas carbonis]
MTNSNALLVKVRGNGHSVTQALAAGGDGWQVEPILSVPARDTNGKALGAGGTEPSTWLRVNRGGGAGTAWDKAHALVGPTSPLAGAMGLQEIEAVEPDLEQQWEFQGDQGSRDAALAAADRCRFETQTREGGRALGQGLAWHLGDDFSGLRAARHQVDDKQRVIRVAHLDTGFDPQHVIRPKGLRLDLQRNFMRGEQANDASDQTPPGMAWKRNRGHGAATLALLAGGGFPATPPDWSGFTGEFGGAPDVEVIPIRIADWVVRFTVGTMVQGFDYARANGAHVLSMSMGGVSSQALTDAVNLAYDAGIVMVTAAGNNISRRPTPKTVVFPARFRRVLAACGVMADGRPYTGLDAGTMQGNFGPTEKMATALGAYTPNVPWAKIGCGTVVDMDGAGTSSATPQIAAAAALWLAEHWETVRQYPHAWMRVEAVRQALFSTAGKTTGQMGPERVFETLGQGTVRAHAALAFQPLASTRLVRAAPAEASWSWLNVLFGQGGVSLTQRWTPQQRAMLALELTQMAQRAREVDDAIDDPDRPAEDIPPAARNRYLEAALAAGNPSKPAREFLESVLGKSGPTSATKGIVRAPVKRRTRAVVPPNRRLRVYALDPSLGRRLESSALRETVLTLPWDDEPLNKDPLRPGPVGEYLEVIDIDPASGKIYEPVDLNDRFLLAQDGLPPSEGNPQFHQQMIYAVAMTTIGHFERALGRPALWAPDGDKETRRLRIYPHALREENAYYSPEKRALLFGYFPARSDRGDSVAPGSMVFTCLSSDIIAHEMSHALLDGLHRRFEEASNPDVVAFHEAFADIVALFQHFTITELVRFEIGKARGDLSAAKLLGGLAKEFGEGANRRGPLRDYVGTDITQLDYETTTQPHARGSILVHAIYEAFLSVVSRRTADLVRMATGGTGVLPAGALHPDLVARLSTETCATATYFLQMCIRALDYCPPVDITFGEFLRAVITADRDLATNDAHGYRTAILEAFGRRGILPSGIRTVSEETLAWGTFEDSRPTYLPKLTAAIRIPWAKELDRSEIFKLSQRNRWALWTALGKVFAEHPEALREFGLAPNMPRYKRDGSAMGDLKPGSTTFEVHNVRFARRLAPDGSFRTEVIAVITQRQPLWRDPKDHSKGFTWFRGGATLILDPREGKEEIRYSIIKNSASTSRQARQHKMGERGYLSPLRKLYFGEDTAEPFALIHADRGGEHGH